MANYKLLINIKTNDRGELRCQRVRIPLNKNAYQALYDQFQGDDESAQCHITSLGLCVNQCADAYLLNDGQVTAGIRNMCNIDEHSDKATFKKR